VPFSTHSVSHRRFVAYPLSPTAATLNGYALFNGYNGYIVCVWGGGGGT